MIASGAADQCASPAQVEVQSLRNSLAEWQSIGELAGVAEAFIMGPVTPAAVAGELARTRESEKQLQVRHRRGMPAEQNAVWPHTRAVHPAGRGLDPKHTTTDASIGCSVVRYASFKGVQLGITWHAHVRFAL